MSQTVFKWCKKKNRNTKWVCRSAQRAEKSWGVGRTLCSIHIAQYSNTSRIKLAGSRNTRFTGSLKSSFADQEAKWREVFFKFNSVLHSVGNGFLFFFPLP